MSSKNKQYKIEKGLLLFTQPRSPYFYGKIRLNRKYVTKSFAPITDIEEAKIMLFSWKQELLSKDSILSKPIAAKENFKSRLEYVEHVAVDNDSSSWMLGVLTQVKRILKKEKLTLLKYMVITISLKHPINLIDA